MAANGAGASGFRGGWRHGRGTSESLDFAFGKKQEKTFLNELFGRFARRRQSRPEGSAITKEEDIAVTKEDATAAVAIAENIIAEGVVTEENITAGTVSEEAVTEVGDELYSGRVELRIAQPADFIQVLRLQAFLREVAGLWLVSVGGSADGDSTIVVHAEERLPLPSILSQEPIVSSVVKRENGLHLVMETI